MIKKIILVSALMLSCSGVTSCMDTREHISQVQKKRDEKKRSQFCRPSQCFGLWAILNVAFFGCIFAPRVFAHQSNDSHGLKQAKKQFAGVKEIDETEFDFQANICDNKLDLYDRFHCRNEFLKQYYSAGEQEGEYFVQDTQQTRREISKLGYDHECIMNIEDEKIQKEKQECLKIKSSLCISCLDKVLSKHVVCGVVKDGPATSNAVTWLIDHTAEINEVKNNCSCGVYLEQKKK